LLSLSASPALGPCGIPDAGPDEDAAGAEVVALDVVELGEVEPPHAARARHMKMSAPLASRLIDLHVAVLMARFLRCCGSVIALVGQRDAGATIGQMVGLGALRWWPLSQRSLRSTSKQDAWTRESFPARKPLAGFTLELTLD
jgi:hypothetical protein